MDIQKIIQDLRDELNQHNHNYYVLDTPTISDFEFDQKLKQLQELENQHPEFYDDNSPTQRVGGTITKNFNTVVHDYRMYSLENSYSKEDLIDWENRIQKVLGNVSLQYTCELKYDGASISITYENGKLNRAVTRGDGFQGDDVTNNIKTIKSIPLKLKGKYPERFDIRGEIILPFEIEEKENAICFVGAISRLRGVKQLIEATSIANVKLYLAGKFSESDFEQEVKNLPAWKNVVECGHLDRKQVANLMAKCIGGIVTFLPAPNHCNAQPNKMFEYMESGLPIICSDYDLWIDVIEKYNCGIYVKPGDVLGIKNGRNFFRPFVGLRPSFFISLNLVKPLRIWKV